MDLEKDFKNAIDRSSSIRQKPANEELLSLYALYKQASEGDVTGERPGGFDFKGAAKYDAWAEMKGKDQQECRLEYIDLVNRLVEKYNS